MGVFLRLVPWSSWPVGVPSRPAALWCYGLMQVCGRFAALSRIPFFAASHMHKRPNPKNHHYAWPHVTKWHGPISCGGQKMLWDMLLKTGQFRKKHQTKKNRPTWLYTQMDRTKNLWMLRWCSWLLFVLQALRTDARLFFASEEFEGHGNEQEVAKCPWEILKCSEPQGRAERDKRQGWSVAQRR